MDSEQPRLAVAVPLDDRVVSRPLPRLRADPSAPVGRLFDAHYRPLVQLAAAVLRDPSWAEDVVQECFVQLHMKWSSLRDQDLALAYLRASVINRARTELRRRRVRSLITQRDEPALRAEDQVMDRLRNSQLLDAIADLPRRQREVTLLRFLNELTIAETASVLKITQGAVMASQSRAIQSLRLRLGDAI